MQAESTPPSFPVPHFHETNPKPTVPEPPIPSASAYVNPGASPTEAIPYISLERVVVCSRGSAFDARQSGEARLDDYIVLTKQLHDISESNFDYRDLRHVGFHPNIIRGLSRNRKFVDRVTSQVAQALQNKRAVLIFECSKGRHRSVAASLLACYLFEHFIEHQHVVC